MRNRRELADERAFTYQILGGIIALIMVVILSVGGIETSSGKLGSTDHASALPPASELIRIQADKYIIRDIVQFEPYSICRGDDASDDIVEQNRIAAFDNAVFVECYYDQHWAVKETTPVNYAQGMSNVVTHPVFIVLSGVMLLAWLCLSAVPFYWDAHRFKSSERKALKAAEADNWKREYERLEREIEEMRNL